MTSQTKAAFLAGHQKLTADQALADIAFTPTTESIMECYQEIVKNLPSNKSDAQADDPMDVLLDAHWAFINKLDQATLSEYEPNYVGAIKNSNLALAIKKIALQECDVELSALYSDQKITDSVTLCIWSHAMPYPVDRPEITVKSLVEQVVNDRYTAPAEEVDASSINDLKELKKLLQNQVEYIEAKIQEAQR